MRMLMNVLMRLSACLTPWVLQGALRIGADLTPRHRHAVLEAKARHGLPPGTIMIGGQRVRINVRDTAQEDPDTETEAETQAEGSPEGQQ